MSKLIALRLPDDLAAELDKRISELAIDRTGYIVNALRVYLERIVPNEPSSWKDLPVPVAKPAQPICKECGSLNGLHQKGCKAKH